MSEFLPIVYVAGPYTNPDPVENTHNAIKAADDLYVRGVCVPIIPHLSLLWHMVRPHTDVNFWYDYDILIMLRCDAVLRLPGVSSGADREVEIAVAHNIPVFDRDDELVDWCSTFTRNKENI